MKYLLLIALLCSPLMARDAGRFVRRANLVNDIRSAWNMEIGQTSPVDSSKILLKAFDDSGTGFVVKRNGKLLIARFDSKQADPTAWLMLDFKGSFSATAQKVAGVRCITLDTTSGQTTTRRLFALHENKIVQSTKFEYASKRELDGGKVIATRSAKFQKAKDAWLRVDTSEQRIGNATVDGSIENTTSTVTWDKGVMAVKAQTQALTSISALLQLSREMELKQFSETAKFYAERAADRAATLNLEANDPRLLKANASLMRLNARVEAQVTIENSK
ncbi:hypothetical protein OAU50_06570 [Planctomycetota bacterium]|nr:hypothetical protein [Planctomycetota bacterium]